MRMDHPADCTLFPLCLQREEIVSLEDKVTECWFLEEACCVCVNPLDWGETLMEEGVEGVAELVIFTCGA